MDKSDAQAGSGAVLGRVCGVQEVGKEEADVREGHTDHAVPNEGKEGTDGKALDVDFVRGREARGKDGGGFPVGRGGVCSGCFVGLDLKGLISGCGDGEREEGSWKDLTGGFSSSCFSPRSGLAFRFAKTPSLEEAKVE